MYQFKNEATSYLNVKLVSDLDYEEIKALGRKKIGSGEVHEYLRYVLDADIEGKIKEVWDECEDNSEKVDLSSFFQKISRMGVHFTEAIVIEIPVLQKRINLLKQVVTNLPKSVIS